MPMMLATRPSITSFALAAVLLLAGAARVSAQDGGGSATAPLRVTAYVAPVLTIDGLVMSTASSDGSTATAHEVAVRGNVPHQLSVRLATPSAGARVEVRGSDGAWHDISAGSRVVVGGSEALGRTVHRLTCRVSAGGAASPSCALVYHVASTQADAPAHMSLIGAPASVVPGEAAILVATGY